jgi:hypothetical protein
MSIRARASEFPNDNAALHRGAVWVTPEPCAGWEAERLATPAPSDVTAPAFAPALAPALASARAPASAPAPAPASAPASAPAPEPELAPAPAPAFALAPEPEPAPSPSPPLEDDEIEVVEELDPIDLDLASAHDDPFATFIGTLVDVAIEAGCDKAAAILPALLDGGRVLPGVLPASVTDALLESGMLALTEGGLVGGEAFRKTASAWKAILRGDSEDFSSCGTRMLDEWAADLVACIVAAPSKTERLRRELRTRGVAAFGLVLAA